MVTLLPHVVAPIVKENINEELIIKLSKYTYLEYQLRNKKD